MLGTDQSSKQSIVRIRNEGVSKTRCLNVLVDRDLDKPGAHPPCGNTPCTPSTSSAEVYRQNRLSLKLEKG